METGICAFFRYLFFTIKDRNCKEKELNEIFCLCWGFILNKPEKDLNISTQTSIAWPGFIYSGSSDISKNCIRCINYVTTPSFRWVICACVEIHLNDVMWYKWNQSIDLNQNSKDWLDLVVKHRSIMSPLCWIIWR